MKKRLRIPLIAAVLWGFCLTTLYAQDRTVRGRVTTEAAEPLAGVSVVLKGTTRGTTTDAQGQYSLAIPTTNARLTFSSVGYAAQDVAVGERTTLDVTLRTSDRNLDEVVVVGYGTVRKSDLTGSVASVKAAELKQTPIANFAQGLQARASGVQVTQNSGAPGGSLTVRIRGNNSISGSSEPLYVIDGFPISGGDNPVAIGGAGFGTANGNRLSVLSTLNPSDIESIEVLKDASATAIYGTRGANGVVLITTKRGKSGQTRVSYEGYYGVQQVQKKLDLMNATEFAQLENQISGQPLYPNPDQLGEGTDWQSLIFRKAPIQSHQVSVSGGNEKTLFNLSTNFFKQEGIIIGSDFTRGSVRLNLDNTISRRVKVGANLTYNYAVNNGAVTASTGEGANAGIVTSALLAPPTIAAYDSLGNPTIMSGRYLERNNPLGLATEVLNRNTTQRFLGNLFVDWTIAEGLTYRASFGGDLIADTRDSYVTRNIRAGSTAGGLGGKGHNNSNTILHESILTYHRSFGNHDLTLTGVFSTQSQTQASDDISAQQFPNDLLENNNLNQASVVTVGSYKQSWRLDSYTGRINYGYKNRYLLTLTARADGSSRFGVNNKYGFFPSVAGAWRVSEEPFMQRQNWVSDLKLRVSYGTTGNADIPLYNSLARLGSVGNYNFNNLRVIGIAASNIPNPDLRWEKSGQADVGIDVGFFTNRLQLTADFYHKKTTDLLLSRTVPSSSGFTSVFGNFGSLENKGFEVSVTGAVLTGDLKWDVSGNFSANRNKLLYIDGKRNEIVPAGSSGNSAVASFANTSILRVGQPIGAFYGYFFDGIYQTGESIPAGKFPGDARYRDLNGDGVLSAADQDINGDPNPKYIFGLTNNLRYKGFDLSVFLQGVQGNDIFFAQRLVLENTGGAQNQLQEIVNRWTPTNPSNRYVRASMNQRINQSDVFIEDGSFVRFKNITLGYSLAGAGAGHLAWLRNARVYVSGNNLLTFTKYSGFDPEVNTSGQNNLNLGVDNSGYPGAKSYLIGLQVIF